MLRRGAVKWAYDYDALVTMREVLVARVPSSMGTRNGQRAMWILEILIDHFTQQMKSSEVIPFSFFHRPSSFMSDQDFLKSLTNKGQPVRMARHLYRVNARYREHPTIPKNVKNMNDLVQRILLLLEIPLPKISRHEHRSIAWRERDQLMAERQKVINDRSRKPMVGYRHE